MLSNISISTEGNWGEVSMGHLQEGSIRHTGVVSLERQEVGGSYVSTPAHPSGWRAPPGVLTTGTPHLCHVRAKWVPGTKETPWTERIAGACSWMHWVDLHGNGVARVWVCPHIVHRRSEPETRRLGRQELGIFPKLLQLAGGRGVSCSVMSDSLQPHGL